MILSALLLAAALQGPRDTMLVTAEWLAQHQRDPNLVLLAVGPRARYDSLHIPGARFIDMREVAAPNTPGAPILELPGPAALDSTLEAKGIGDASRIVIYQDDEWFSPATRIYLTLYWAGLGGRTSILDGGMARWRARNGAVTTEVPQPRRGTLTLHPRGDVVVRADWLASHLTDPVVNVVDARDTRFFLGNYEPNAREPRPGHIPGAFNIPFETMVNDSGLVQPVTMLRDLFGTVRAAPGHTLVTYCHIGQQGSLVWFAAKLAGYDVRLYDGSFTEWSGLLQYPVEKW